MQFAKSITFLCIAFLFNCTGDSAGANRPKYTGEKFTKTVSQREFMRMYEAFPYALLIDVRTKEEFQSGTISPDAINVDYRGDNFESEILKHDRNVPVFLYCFSDGRSSKAASKMRELGFDRIYRLKGGYEQW